MCCKKEFCYLVKTTDYQRRYNLIVPIMKFFKENNTFNISTSLISYHSAWLLVGSLLYIAIVYCLYLSHVLNIFIQKEAGFKILWNYLTALILMLIMYLTTGWAKDRPLPSLSRTKSAGLVLCGAVLIYILLLILFWKFVVLSPPPFIKVFELDINNLSTCLPQFSKMRIENAIFALPATAFAVGISIWRLKGWRRYTSKIVYRHVLVVLLLIIMSTCLSFFREKVFSLYSPNILPPFPLTHCWDWLLNSL